MIWKRVDLVEIIYIFGVEIVRTKLKSYLMKQQQNWRTRGCEFEIDKSLRRAGL